MKKYTLLLVAALVLIVPFLVATNTAGDEADREAVREAVLDYVEGIYNVQPERIERSVAPDLAKVGYDVMDMTATVKLSASWGIDYMHLAKIDGKWMIKNVLWQSYPPQEQ